MLESLSQIVQSVFWFFGGWAFWTVAAVLAIIGRVGEGRDLLFWWSGRELKIPERRVLYRWAFLAVVAGAFWSFHRLRVTKNKEILSLERQLASIQPPNTTVEVRGIPELSADRYYSASRGQRRLIVRFGVKTHPIAGIEVSLKSTPVRRRRLDSTPPTTPSWYAFKCDADGSELSDTLFADSSTQVRTTGDLFRKIPEYVWTAEYPDLTITPDESLCFSSYDMIRFEGCTLRARGDAGSYRCDYELAQVPTR